MCPGHLQASTIPAPQPRSRQAEEEGENRNKFSQKSNNIPEILSLCVIWPPLPTKETEEDSTFSPKQSQGSAKKINKERVNLGQNTSSFYRSPAFWLANIQTHPSSHK